MSDQTNSGWEQKCSAVLEEVKEERKRQFSKWGIQDLKSHPAKLGPMMLKSVRLEHEIAQEQGRLTWQHVLAEEFWEAVSETDAARIRAELIQVAAVACQWIEALDRRSA